MGKLSSLIRAAVGKKRFNSAIILAAGSGRRFSDDTAKQFVHVAGESVLIRSAKAFENSELISEIIVVTRRADIEGCRNMLKENGITKVTRVVAGGDTRQKSAKNGFDAVNPACEFVAIHDAARCLVTPEMIEAALESAYVHGACACATKATDTIKKTDGANSITETVNRENAWLVQTPQIFMADMYRAASYMGEKDNIEATDDCALCERLGFKVKLVDVGKTNMKITYPEDIIIAEAILKYREENK